MPRGRAGQNSAQRNSHDADLPRIDLGARGQHVNRATHILDSLGQGFAEEPRVGSQGFGATGRTAFRVVRQFEPDRRDSPRGQGRALQAGQLETAAQDVQANYRRPRLCTGLDSLGQVQLRGNRVILRQRARCTGEGYVSR